LPGPSSRAFRLSPNPPGIARPRGLEGAHSLSIQTASYHETGWHLRERERKRDGEWKRERERERERERGGGGGGGKREEKEEKYRSSFLQDSDSTTDFMFSSLR